MKWSVHIVYTAFHSIDQPLFRYTLMFVNNCMTQATEDWSGINIYRMQMRMQQLITMTAF